MLVIVVSADVGSAGICCGGAAKARVAGSSRVESSESLMLRLVRDGMNYCRIEKRVYGPESNLICCRMIMSTRARVLGQAAAVEIYPGSFFPRMIVPAG